MNFDINQLPLWLIVAILVIILAVLVYAVATGRNVDFWGFKIGKPDQEEKPVNLVLKDWHADENFLSTLRGLRNEESNVKIRFYDVRHYPFIERLASAFEHAGWKVQSSGSAQGQRINRYVGGITVAGANRTVIEKIASAIGEFGFSNVDFEVKGHDITHDHVNFPMAQNRVNIIVGYE